MIAIIDYGMGNLRNVEKAFERTETISEHEVAKPQCPKCGSNLFAGFCQEHGQQGIVKVIRANRFLKMLGIADDQVNVDYPAPLGSF